MAIGRSRTPHRDALEKAVRYAEEAERCDAEQHYEDRDVRLKFASVWASIAIASRPTTQQTRATTSPKEL